MIHMKTCEHCGKQFQRPRTPGGQLLAPSVFALRRFCSPRCQYEAARKPLSEIAISTQGYHAHKHIGTECETCGDVEDLVVHHVNGDRTNNSADNLQTLCRGCHVRHHNLNREYRRKTPDPCPVCYENIRRNGLCPKCDHRKKAHGSPYLKMIQVRGGGRKLISVVGLDPQFCGFIGGAP